mmetsp:Transcript_7837/g.22324  ORF Transcript_7837/g.22324 Transcript_7837/m.22324 type:complete len:97 (+) Transcript_7837:1625-1915(+)
MPTIIHKPTRQWPSSCTMGLSPLTRRLLSYIPHQVTAFVTLLMAIRDSIPPCWPNCYELHLGVCWTMVKLTTRFCLLQAATFIPSEPYPTALFWMY